MGKLSRKESRVLGCSRSWTTTLGCEGHWTVWMGFPGGLCCSALVTSVVELVPAVTAVSSESHHAQAGQAPEVQHGGEAPGMIADAGLGSGFSLKDFGVIGNAGLAVACWQPGWYFLAHVFAERSVHNLTASPHRDFPWAWSEQWCSLTRGK